jgi:hypothetical protein
MRNMKSALVTLLIALTVWATASVAQTGEGAQTPPRIQDPPRCPVVTVSCPDSSIPDGRLVFAANVSGGDPNLKPTFKWTVSGGEITGGQGTSSITVDISKVGRQFVTATVDVGGLGRDYRDCALSSSCTNSPGDPPTSRKIDEYGDIPVGEEKLRLDNIAVELQNDPTSQTCLICYGGRRGGPRAAARRCERAKNYLISSRGIAVGRVRIIDGGYREGLTVEAWIVPSGAEPPQPSPTVFPRGRGRH